ncbi:2-C-methyl-D-erythritol 4-phosphate cytidylyltransferase [Nostoc sp. CHAB 5784]|uniref:2-C-methyl-D-erythritol 4-phosphate cytidylyltransferase n=1 Tax=Nostoc mirabile TaxID=2907820 RepID=UPI001E52C2AA|nr:2-C-methyl-D-erythritol 4-phosphate cytidylyltransferase [Nostoc mirabile]MCC5668152.1 2-C-methyl-D-erythritol 4-phosphate cytidylyltransferase [Nostoc mirabile CHAB5784]
MYLLIPAAGQGRRMQSSRNKLLLTLLDEPIIAWTLKAAEASEQIHWIGVICQPEDLVDFQEIVANLSLTKPVHFILGGATRQDSVYNGLQSLPAMAERVLIHDGARCLVTPKLFDRCALEILNSQGLIAAVPVKDTIKIVEPQTNVITNTPDRCQLWAAQTPQGFEVELLQQCHDKGRYQGWEVTDDATLFEQCQLPVQIVQGEETNLKVTTPVDLALAEFILRQRLEEQLRQSLDTISTLTR